VMKDVPTYYLTCTGGDGQGNLFPIYSSTNLARWVGPGHNAITQGPDGRTWIVHHAYELSEGTPRCGEPVACNDTRHSLVDRITWKNNWPSVSSRL
jgi:GH43 family beta-xylosidase